MKTLKQIVMGEYGEKHSLKSAEGFWFTPKKFTVSEQDQISACQKKLIGGVDKKALVTLLTKQAKAESLTEDEAEKIIDGLTSEEIGSMIDIQNVEKAPNYRLIIKFGIHSSNMVEGFEASETTSVPDDLIETILSDQHLAEEVVGVINEYNRPLATRKGKTSGIAPNGPSKDQNSIQGTPSLTDGARP